MLRLSPPPTGPSPPARSWWGSGRAGASCAAGRCGLGPSEAAPSCGAPAPQAPSRLCPPEWASPWLLSRVLSSGVPSIHSPWPGLQALGPLRGVGWYGPRGRTLGTAHGQASGPEPPPGGEQAKHRMKPRCKCAIPKPSLPILILQQSGRHTWPRCVAWLTWQPIHSSVTSGSPHCSALLPWGAGGLGLKFLPAWLRSAAAAGTHPRRETSPSAGHTPSVPTPRSGEGRAKEASSGSVVGRGVGGQPGGAQRVLGGEAALCEAGTVETQRDVFV